MMNVLPLPPTPNVEARARRHKATPAMAVIAAKILRQCGIFMLLLL